MLLTPRLHHHVVKCWIHSSDLGYSRITVSIAFRTGCAHFQKDKVVVYCQRTSKMKGLVLAMNQDTLISVGKVADVGYNTIFDEGEVNVYDR